MPFPSRLPRRQFLKFAAATAAAAASPASPASLVAPSASRMLIVIDPADAVASAGAVSFAARRLQESLRARNVIVEISGSVGPGKAERTIHVSSAPTLAGFPAAKSPATHPESVRIAPGPADSLLVSSPGVLGLVYGLTDLSDRVECSDNSTLGLRFPGPTDEVPANEVRSAARAFCSEVEDKPWYYSKEFWRGYLDTLVTSRFNRFNLAFGFGYDFPKGVTGDYFHFPYPYLVEVPGYDVHVVPLAAGERERNLDALRFIASETAARGLQFQLGLWTHAFEWTDSPKADHRVVGLNAQNHAPYCRDALAMLLKLCPEITGVTLRVHGESGVPEGSYDFWRTLFEALKHAGRPIEIDMHAKGINQIMIDMGSDTGMPVKVSAKSWAEHMGLGYQQADIRELEIPTPARMESGTFNVSNGERRFTRYGYADLFQEDRKYNVLFRLWPGTQHTLLWGDPEMAAAYSRTAHFCGAAGLEICEPLTFKGREGSGLPGGRCAYLDAALEPAQDWQKFAYTYRLWGRMLYNPETAPDVWRRSLARQFGPGYAAAESSLANASRVLPLVTTAHLPSASNHSFWPEIYTNMAIVPGQPSPYSDTPKPYRFGTVSPLDPQIFAPIDEFVRNLLRGIPDPRYSPLTVARWLEDFTGTATSALSLFRKQGSGPNTPEFRRWEEDVLIQAALGRFFAAKLRSGVAFETFLETGNPEAGRITLSKYTEARDTWAAMAARAARIYKPDITYGAPVYRRGHWSDRLPSIETDLAAMRTAVGHPPAPATTASASVFSLLTNTPARPSFNAHHVAATSFTPGHSLPVHMDAGAAGITAEFFYRHVNQGERWKSTPMTRTGLTFEAAIPGAYTSSPYPLQYYFVLTRNGTAAYHPEFNRTLSNEPYFTVYRRT